MYSSLVDSAGPLIASRCHAISRQYVHRIHVCDFFQESVQLGTFNVLLTELEVEGALAWQRNMMPKFESDLSLSPF